ncbi:MAG TPA: FAD-dependent oxidoreductase [Bacteroidia bacterium]|nr:FAD-dependent oxidoreductase [Bacteroidia bacterium]
MPDKHILIIGGGIFGLTTAIVLGEKGYQVTVIEKNNDLMQEASLVNQNRIHYGYHYPRSKATCQESLAGLLSFKEFYGDAINASFKKYYAIAKNNSHINAQQFKDFCISLNLPLTEAWPQDGILNRDLLENCWLTPEPIFDFEKLKQLITYRLLKCKNVKIFRNTKVTSLKETTGDKEVTLSNYIKISCQFIINATYSGLSDLLVQFGRDAIKAKFQLCVMPILEIKKTVNPFGVTIMDGPFCSLMPKGFEKDKFILYHVTHSVIQQHIGEKSLKWTPIEDIVEMEIMEKSTQYYPIIENMKLIDTWITTRIVLPNQEIDDARPTLIMNNENNIYSIFSGKLTTCVDVAKQVVDLISKN